MVSAYRFETDGFWLGNWCGNLVVGQLASVGQLGAIHFGLHARFSYANICTSVCALHLFRLALARK